MYIQLHQSCSASKTRLRRPLHETIGLTSIGDHADAFTVGLPTEEDSSLGLGALSETQQALLNELGVE